MTMIRTRFQRATKSTIFSFLPLSIVPLTRFGGIGSSENLRDFGDVTRKIVTLLNKCNSIKNVNQIHAYLITNPVNKITFLLAKIIELKDLDYATLIFSQMEEPNVFSYNVMIRALATTWKKYDAAVDMFYRMRLSGLKPDNYTYPFLLLSCANLGWLGCGSCAHSSVFKAGLHIDNYIRHSLITMYSRCCEIRLAQKVFDEITDKDLVSWNSMISGYSKMGYANEAVGLFRRMRMSGMEPDGMTLTSVIGACGDLGDLNLGKWIEGLIEEKRIISDSFIGSSLIDMYGRCGDLISARRLFDRMLDRHVVTWNAMITGQYAQNGASEEAISLYNVMREAHIEPDKITVVGVLSACASIGALEIGIHLDEYASGKGLRYDIYVGTSLIDMYAKCGSLEHARSIFVEMPCRNVVCFNAMITAFAIHGHAKEAISLFNTMINSSQNLYPNDITFVGLLSACVHAGMMDDGKKLFDSMNSKFGLIPKVEHYSCMVDLLARAGCLDEAWAFIEKMPNEPDAITLGALLYACRKFQNVNVVDKIIDRLLELEPLNSGNYITSFKTYIDAKRWEDSARIRGLMRERGVTKVAGCSWIEVNYQVHEFHVCEDSHINSREIYELIKVLTEEIEMEGYIPNFGFY